MSIDQKVVLSQIDLALERWSEARARSQHDDCSDLPSTETAEILTLIAATIDRLAPPGSRYRKNTHAVLKKHGEVNPYNLKILPGILKALRADYMAGHLQAIHELIHADVFADFLEMADYLLEEDYKDPAAVIAGGVLEEHLRKLCQKNNIEITKGDRYKKADSLNVELAGASVYSKLDQKSVTAWLDLRNKAAHGRYGEYTKEQVALMVRGIRDFVSRYTA
ncbi:MAG: hypothetical protein KAX20_03550 [Candidatus Omnitrophica bacterium]|nr:hypothetical protein [Candidatus Omnitrophota bacterium]